MIEFIIKPQNSKCVTISISPYSENKDYGMDRFKGKYRIPSHRRPGWNYAGNGSYFITFVTYDRQCLFGNIQNGHMLLNDFGNIAHEEWYRSFLMRNELFSDAFIIMPNHIHAIVTIHKRETGLTETHGRASLHQNHSLERKPKSISSFLAGYKSAVIRSIDDLIDERALPVSKFNRTNPLWQANYHDRIIRNADEFHLISWYIEHNPESWEQDRFYI